MCSSPWREEYETKRACPFSDRRPSEDTRTNSSVDEPPDMDLGAPHRAFDPTKAGRGWLRPRRSRQPIAASATCSPDRAGGLTRSQTQLGSRRDETECGSPAWGCDNFFFFRFTITTDIMEKPEVLEKLHCLPIILFVGWPTTVLITWVFSLLPIFKKITFSL